MRKTISAIMLATLLTPALAMAQPGRDDHRDDHRGGPDHGPAMRGGPDHGPNRGGPGGPPNGWHQFRQGQRFDRAHAWNYGEIDYRRYGNRLRPPPRGYHWVRNGNDALLVGITTGVIASVIAGNF
ncbi:RcnB family protein [Novosphingobium terrae]|jgi:Ni/Co efflux regulator RcnB|uniref:RcnB family protein n=1 Tax=Novosphingobium terrae TaxID=2726189 RepID=UPI00197F06D3|nr:RcnB family protein [Novosphingobium terrae]